MTVADDITRELELADTVVESTFGGEGQRRYALEAGVRICSVPGVRVTRVDSAELIGFIHNTITARPRQGYDELASAIVAEFDLEDR